MDIWRQLGVFWNKPFVAEALGMDSEKFRPMLMLSYPVITSGEKAHKGSFESVLGEDYADEEKRRFLSLEYNVTKDTPSTFLWHTAPDDTVPVENSLLFFQALHALDIPAELHIYPVAVMVWDLPLQKQHAPMAMESRQNVRAGFSLPVTG